MARKLSRREIGFVSLLGVAGLIYVLYSDGGVLKGPGGDPGLIDDDAPRDAAPVVRMDLLQASLAEYGQDGRDLFKYEKRPPTQAELDAMKRQQDLANQRRQAAAEQRQAKKKAPPPRKPRPTGPRLPRVTFEYVGYLGPKEDRIAVFEEGQELILGRSGDVVRDEFRVVEIQYDTVIIGFTDPKFEDKTQTLRMTKR